VLKKAAEEFKATVVKPDEIFGLDVDIFAPCALGAVINDKTIPQLKCSIVAGGANNPLEDEEKHAEDLLKRGILYAPDYVINAGGLLDVSAEYFHAGRALAMEKTEKIYNTLLQIFHVAEAEKITPNQASRNLAEARIHAIKQCDNIFTRRGKSRR
jgi:leucine dehydrogenase